MIQGTPVFVYGTLRRGASNAWRMADAEFVGSGSVRGTLYHIDWYPGMVLDDAAGAVRGEVFRVNDALLESLNEYEGDEYRRVMAMVTLDGGQRLDAVVWVYRGDPANFPPIASGDWLEPA